jgi:hypothetical protein
MTDWTAIEVVGKPELEGPLVGQQGRPVVNAFRIRLSGEMDWEWRRYFKELSAGTPDEFGIVLPGGQMDRSVQAIVPEGRLAEALVEVKRRIAEANKHHADVVLPERARQAEEVRQHELDLETQAQRAQLEIDQLGD